MYTGIFLTIFVLLHAFCVTCFRGQVSRSLYDPLKFIDCMKDALNNTEYTESCLNLLKENESNIFKIMSKYFSRLSSQQDAVDDSSEFSRTMKASIQELSDDVLKIKQESYFTYQTIQRLLQVIYLTDNSEKKLEGTTQAIDKILRQISTLRNFSLLSNEESMTRNALVPTRISNITYLGCYVDSWPRDLNGSYFQGNVSVDFCKEACKTFRYFALANKDECICGNSFGHYGKAFQEECFHTCPGNSLDKCGGLLRNSVYYVSAAVQDEEREGYIGCFADSWPRDLSGIYTRGKMNVTVCRKYCAGYKFFGLSMKDTCTCSNFYGHYGRVAEENCLFTCTGNEQQICGGMWKNSIYRVPQFGVEIADSMGYMGCFIDGKVNEVENLFVQNKKMSVQLCGNLCHSFKYFGLQRTHECHCSNLFQKNGVVEEVECNMKCSGNETQMCGGQHRLNIYSTKHFSPPLVTRGKVVSMSSVHSSSFVPEKAIDDVQESFIHTSLETNPWWKIDLGKSHLIQIMKMWTAHHENYFAGLIIQFSVDNNIWSEVGKLPANTIPRQVYTKHFNHRTRFIRLVLPKHNHLVFNEVEIYGIPLEL